MSDENSSIMQRLEAETSNLHAHAESRMLQREIAKGVVDRATFVSYLGQVYKAHGALEEALRQARSQSVARVPSIRSRSANHRSA